MAYGTGTAGRTDTRTDGQFGINMVGLLVAKLKKVKIRLKPRLRTSGLPNEIGM